jgi:hypothetical protein
LDRSRKFRYNPSRQGYRGWITLDPDPPRLGEGTIEENLEIDKKCLCEKLGVKL